MDHVDPSQLLSLIKTNKISSLHDFLYKKSMFTCKIIQKKECNAIMWTSSELTTPSHHNLSFLYIR